MSETFKIRNTYLDHSKFHLHRVAAKLETEPLIEGRRLNPRMTLPASAEWVERNHVYLERLAKTGIIEIIAPDGRKVDHEAMTVNPAALDEVQSEVLVNLAAVEKLEFSDPPPVVVAETPVPPVPSEAPVVEEPAPAAPEAPKPQQKGKWKHKG